MPEQPKEATEKGESTLRTKVFREFSGVNTRADRTSIPEQDFFELLNLIPIGHANLHTIPDVVAAANGAYGADIVYWAQYANINSTDYIFVFTTNGKIFANNIGAGTSAQINVGHLMGGAATRMDQWKNQFVLFVDPTAGYCSWDGTTFTAGITGGILPVSFGSVVDIAVFSDYVWIYSKRTLYISAIDSITDFTLIDGALAQNITDPQARGEVVRMISGNGYLYLLFKSSIFVIADVYIQQGAVPPAPSFFILNVQGQIGCDQPASVFFYNRSLMFANTYGLFSLDGADVTRVSENIDGTIQYLDTSLSISGGAAKVQNILNACFLIKVAGDPVFGARTVIAMMFDRKWWFADYDVGGFEETFICWASKGGIPALYFMANNTLYQAFANTASSPPAAWKTALWNMGDSIADKEVFRVGMEITNANQGTGVTLNVDTQFASNPAAIKNTAGTITWSNNSSSIVQWQNNALALVAWFSTVYLLYVGDGQGAFAKYVGLSGSSVQGMVFQLSSQMMDYSLRKRW